MWTDDDGSLCRVHPHPFGSTFILLILDSSKDPTFHKRFQTWFRLPYAQFTELHQSLQSVALFRRWHDGETVGFGTEVRKTPIPLHWLTFLQYLGSKLDLQWPFTRDSEHASSVPAIRWNLGVGMMGKQLVFGQKWEKTPIPLHLLTSVQYLGQNWTVDDLLENTGMFTEASSIDSFNTGVQCYPTPLCYCSNNMWRSASQHEREPIGQAGSQEPSAQPMQLTSCLKRCSTSFGKLTLDSRWPTLPEDTTKPSTTIDVSF